MSKIGSVIALAVIIGIGYYAVCSYNAAAKEEEAFEKSEAWKMQLVAEIDEATSQMWACSSSVWAWNGKGQTPECQKACQSYHDFIQKERMPPAYVRGNVPQYVDKDASTGDGVCGKSLNESTFERGGSHD